MNYYDENFSQLEQARSKMEVCGLPYPQMKILDMGFWQIGFENDQNKGVKHIKMSTYYIRTEER